MTPVSLEARRGPDEDAPGILSELTFSVIVPAYNRSDSLRRLLQALAAQRFPLDRFEVLICDDGSTENLADVVQQAAAETALRIMYLRQPNRGPGAARNLGLAHASATVVAFTDSDCIPQPDWLAALAHAFDDHDVALVGGNVDYLDSEHFSGRCINFLTGTSLGGAGASDPRSVVRMDYHPRTMNLAVRRTVALAAGGFPPHLRGEDLEFTHRVRSIVPGLRVRFVAEASILHNEDRTVRQSFIEQMRRGIARIRLLREHGLHQPIHAVPAALVVNLAAIPLLAATAPTLAAIAAVPQALYLLALGALSVQGTIALRDPRALVAVPAYALSIHFGYGVGYLAALLGLVPTGAPGDAANRAISPCDSTSSVVHGTPEPASSDSPCAGRP